MNKIPPIDYAIIINLEDDMHIDNHKVHVKEQDVVVGEAAITHGQIGVKHHTRLPLSLSV
jgi:hypothetical protein